jgi:hypothetical protein
MSLQIAYATMVCSRRDFRKCVHLGNTHLP